MLSKLLTAESFLEYAFLRWVLQPLAKAEIAQYIVPQKKVAVAGRTYRLDYAIEGIRQNIAVELDGFEFHGGRVAFTYDRLRQNDLHTLGWTVIRFSYDAIRLETARCVAQLQTILRQDSRLAPLLYENPQIEVPQMEPDALGGLTAMSSAVPDRTPGYFDTIRNKLDMRTLRTCQVEAFAALGNYFGAGGTNAACVMSVGAGKTVLGVVTALAFTRQRAMIITPGNVIRGTFDRALDYQAIGNALYGLPTGPLLPGCKPPHVLTLDRDNGPIRTITRQDLLAADIILTNFHSLGTGADPDDLLAKLQPDDIDLIVVDEAHIAAAESYQRMFSYFSGARTLLMSACFQRLDGKPIDADVVYRYRLVDAIADGHAKNLCVHRFEPNAEQTVYEMVWPDGSREEIVGRETLLDLIKNEQKLARITAKSDASIRHIMRSVRVALDRQQEILFPVKPRVLFSALGERHAEQIARIATEHGIPSDYLHHSMSEARIRTVRERYEQDSGDLQGIVQLKMLGQGYDFPPICIVVPIRPYGSFSEFYQFIGRGIRVLQHSALVGRAGPDAQFLDIIYHAEMDLDRHIHTIYQENDMDPSSANELPSTPAITINGTHLGNGVDETTYRPEAFVLFEQGAIERRVIHDEDRVEQRRTERELAALAERYAAYAQSTSNPIAFAKYVEIMRSLSG